MLLVVVTVTMAHVLISIQWSVTILAETNGKKCHQCIGVEEQLVLLHWEDVCMLLEDMIQVILASLHMSSYVFIPLISGVSMYENITYWYILCALSMYSVSYYMYIVVCPFLL